MYAAHHWIGIHASPSQLQSCEPFHQFHALPCFPQLLLQVCLAFSSKRQVQTFQSPPECSGAPLGFLEAGASNPCLAGARRKPGKGTPVRVGNLPMKWECVHTKALTPGGDHNSQRHHSTFQPKTLDEIAFCLSEPFEPPLDYSVICKFYFAGFLLVYLSSMDQPSTTNKWL